MIGVVTAAFGLVAVAGPGARVGDEAGAEISRTRGSSRGIVVLWPRVVPPTDDPAIQDLAGRMRDRLYAAAAKVVPYRRVDVRPSPQRVCPRSGCRAPAVSVMIGHREGGCVIVGFLHPPGPVDPHPWAIGGQVDLLATLDFRDPPERSIVVREFLPCAYVESGFDEAAVVEGLRALSSGLRPAAIQELKPVSAVQADRLREASEATD